MRKYRDLLRGIKRIISYCFATAPGDSRLQKDEVGDVGREGKREEDGEEQERNLKLTSPNEEDRRSEVTLIRTDHVRSDDRDDGVPEPVGGGGESDTTGSDGDLRKEETDKSGNSSD